MSSHNHRFVEEYDGLIGFGLEREINESTLICYLQKFSDDDLMALLRTRMSDQDLEDLFELLGKLLKTYLSEEEYHVYFLKDEIRVPDPPPVHNE